MSKLGGCFLESSLLQTRHSGGVLLDKLANATWAQTDVQGFEKIKKVIIVEGSGVTAHVEECNRGFLFMHTRACAEPSQEDLWMLE